MNQYKSRTKRNMGRLLVVTIAFIAFWTYTVYDRFEVGKMVTPTGHKCTALRGPLGAEDFVKWNGFVLTSNLDAIRLWNWPDHENPSVSKCVVFSSFRPPSLCTD